MRLAAILVTVSVVCAVAYFVFSHPGLDRLEELQYQLSDLEAQNQVLAERNDDLERQILALRDDPRVAERRARESVGLARPDEMIFQFLEPQEEVQVRVRLNMNSERLQLAGRVIKLEELAQKLESLHQEMPRAQLVVGIDDEVGPIERQRVIDIVDQSPMARENGGDEESR